MENIDPAIYERLAKKERQLSEYLRYIRQKQPGPRFVINVDLFKAFPNPKETSNQAKRECKIVRQHVQSYLKLLKEIMAMQNFTGKKILKKTLQFLEQFPTMNFLLETTNSFGKEKKRLCLNQTRIMSVACDDMIPLFLKVIEKIEQLKKEAEGRKLMELGHRIEHLNAVISRTKANVRPDPTNLKYFHTLAQERIEKYLNLEETISKAQKNYGQFSETFSKNKQVFCNINKVCLQIKNTPQLEQFPSIY